MANFLYRCAEQHDTLKIRSWANRDDDVVCHCGRKAARIEIVSMHVPPSGVYSYMPNVGSADRFERQREAMKTGKKVIQRYGNQDKEARDGQYSSKDRE